MSQGKYHIQVDSRFLRITLIDWVTIGEKGLRMLLRWVCGATEEQCEIFINDFDKVSVNSFTSQDEDGYVLIAINERT